ncbi:MAG: glycosyltransferase family 2 protein [Candidatus Electrothrix sp. AUS1_2]|nr:glycosyltransferase family 2 protein [Candidatus Electrothrix sp. AUS1_2]
MASVSVLIYTMNEEIHLQQCIDSLSWCDDIVVVDSFSTDNTEQIARQNGARFFQHSFEGFGSQRNWSLEHIDLHHDWVLILDADERVPEELAQELEKLADLNSSETGAWRLRRRLYMWGKWLRYSSMYPTWTVRFIHKDRVRYINRGHAETQEVEGKIGQLEHDLIDENLKGIDAWFERQNRYSTKDAMYEKGIEDQPLQLAELFSPDPLKRRAALKRLTVGLPFRPFIYFMYSYFFRMGFFDGRRGLQFCLMKALYQRMIMVKKYDCQHTEMK